MEEVAKMEETCISQNGLCLWFTNYSCYKLCIYVYTYLFPWHNKLWWTQWLLTTEASQSHSDTHTHILCREIPGRVISPSQRNLPVKTQYSTRERETFILSPWFEPAIPKSERPQNHTLERAATWISKNQ